MKRVIKYLGVVLTTAISLCSCSDFLERSSQNLIVPSSTRHYKEMLQGEGYFQNISTNSRFVMYMTDDLVFVDITRNQVLINPQDHNMIAQYQDSYRWQNEIESGNFTDNLYKYLYNQVMVANLCLQYVDSSEGTETEREILKGQASFQRAMAYFYLANLYSQAYNEAQETDLCVPLVLVSEATTARFPRATIKDVWGQITSDIETAITMLEGKNIPPLYEVKYASALILGSRIYLYMENYDRAIELGEKFLTECTEYPLYAINTTSASFKKAGTDNTGQESDEAFKNFYRSANTELTWAFGEYGYGTNEWYSYTAPSASARVFSVSYGDASITDETAQPGLIKMYKVDTIATGNNIGDRRYFYWFFPPATSASASVYTKYAFRPLKYDYTDKEIFGQYSMRTGELYCNLMEAYARRNSSSTDTDRALELYNALRNKRIRTFASTSASAFATNEDLVKAMWAERRRELCFEELHRWWDLRRQGQPEIIHSWRGNDRYKLEKNDPAYILNFPTAERDFDESLIPNDRPLRNPM